MGEKREVQWYEIVDSPPTEPFEALVEIYYQLNGYITSSNKWFWFWNEKKQQRGYQDIDILAIKDKETLIVSVTTNLDDKINLIDKKDKQNKLRESFERAERYLREVEKYRWLVEGNRDVKWILAFAHGYRKSGNLEKVKSKLKNEKIELLGPKGYIIDKIKKWVCYYHRELKCENRNKKDENKKHRGYKTNNQLIKLIELMIRMEIEEGRCEKHKNAAAGI